MAVYPEGAPGKYPLDPTSDVGQFRILYGDTSAEAYDPEEPGFRDYGELSDAEIEAFIEQGGGVARGIGYLYLARAGEAAKESISIRDFDLQVDLTKRATDLRALAQVWFGQADNDDLIAGEDAFEIVPTGGGSRNFIPEGTIPLYGRRYVWDHL